MKLDASNRDLFLTINNRRNPQALWDAIKLEYASKKARNRSRFFTCFLSLNCQDGNLAKYVSSFREITREMLNSGVHLDDNLLAHMALHHLPAEHNTTRQVIVATAKSSNSALTLIGVLSQMNELIRDSASTNVTANGLTSCAKNSSNRNLSYARCTNGQHNPKTAHPEESCWQLHPSKSPHNNNSRSSANVASISGRALSAVASRGKSTDKTILDSGSSHHMSINRNHFISHQPLETSIEVANGDTMIGHGVGVVAGSHQGSRLSLSDSLHVPDLKCNLVSLFKLAKKGCSLTFQDDGTFEVNQKDEVALTGKIIDGLMELNLDLGKSNLLKPTAYAVVTDSDFLHSRLGHPGRLPFSKAFPGLPAPSICDPCIMLKHHQLPYRGKFKVAASKLELIHSDLSGIITPPSLGGNRYYF